MCLIPINVISIRSCQGRVAEAKLGIAGSIKDRGTYTIVEVKGTWGKLKSGAGWISLNYCVRV